MRVCGKMHWFAVAIKGRHKFRPVADIKISFYCPLP